MGFNVAKKLGNYLKFVTFFLGFRENDTKLGGLGLVWGSSCDGVVYWFCV